MPAASIRWRPACCRCVSARRPRCAAHCWTPTRRIASGVALGASDRSRAIWKARSIERAPTCRRSTIATSARCSQGFVGEQRAGAADAFGAEARGQARSTSSRARGETVERAPRRIEIAPSRRCELGAAIVSSSTCDCSKGTYIRYLARTSRAARHLRPSSRRCGASGSSRSAAAMVTLEELAAWRRAGDSGLAAWLPAADSASASLAAGRPRTTPARALLLQGKVGRMPAVAASGRATGSTTAHGRFLGLVDVDGRAACAGPAAASWSAAGPAYATPILEQVLLEIIGRAGTMRGSLKGIQGSRSLKRCHCRPSRRAGSSASISRSTKDTGSPEVQIALLSARINELGEHFTAHKRDHASRRGLLKMVNQRRKLLDYLKSTAPERYQDVVAASACGAESPDDAPASPLRGRLRHSAPPIRPLGQHRTGTHRERPSRKLFTTASTGHASKRASSPARPTAPSSSSMGDTVVLVTAVARKEADPKQGLLPAHRQLRREDLRRRPHPGRLLQARRPAHRKGNADLAPDRSPDPPAVSGRLLQRSAGRRDRRLAEPGRRFRHSGDARRIGRAGPVRHAVPGPDRRRARSATTTASTC